MNPIKWLKNKIESIRYGDLFFEEYDDDNEKETVREDNGPIKRDSVNMRSKNQRERYIENCCEQMIEADKEIERSRMEYRLVTEYLTDIEVIEALPNDSKRRLSKIAEKINNLSEQNRANTKSLGLISEERYRILLKNEAQVPDDINNMKKNEEFKELVRQDLQKLEGEKAVSDFKIRELRSTMRNMKNMVVITFVFGVALVIMLSILEFVLLMHAEVGFLATAFLAAGAFIYEYLTYSKSVRELERTERYLNAVISELNKVKIRFVNTSNLLEYEYMKYSVNASDELAYQWDCYIEEKKARQAMERADSALSAERTALLKELRSIRIKDPAIWLNRCDALVNPGEMVEVRHELFERRSSLRKRIEYNTETRDISRDEINSIVKEYPEYGQEVLNIVSSYGPV
ncbi:MAG: hypothetical protein K6A90_03855 [Lachnospiraceae bacterium]|nr:hypothetical protein [Lachnospiraceae bacterium]